MGFVMECNRDHCVAIKSVSKQLHANKECIDEHGFHFIVDEDLLKEAMNLRYLTKYNQPIGDSIVKYIDFIESQTNYYLIIQYIPSNVNLKQFVQQCHKLIKEGKLQLAVYKKITKYILWQIAALLYWLHCDMHCCHLDMCPENIMLVAAEGQIFECNTDGTVSINSNISIKLIDFGVSEFFDESWKCNKQYLSLDNEQYLAPNIEKQRCYDASAADMWNFGMISYFCFFGQYPFKWKEVNEYGRPIIGSGYFAVYRHAILQYLVQNNALKFINAHSLALLNGLLNIDEGARFRCVDVLKCDWFHVYYKQYCAKIKKKSILQKQKRFCRNDEALPLKLIYQILK